MLLKSFWEFCSAYFRFTKKMWRTRTSDSYINFLRKRGIKIGKECVFRDASSATIDLTRPSLVEIGNYVDINLNFTILTHDYATTVFLRTHNEFINSSGRVKIGNNIYFGKNCTILKGVTIGDNVIVGANSLINRDIPSNCVAAGNPARVICSLDEYFEKRRKRCMNEALEYGRSIRDNEHREPVPADFYEEFHLFVDRSNIDRYRSLPIQKQLNHAYPDWLCGHKAEFKDFDDFISNL